MDCSDYPFLRSMRTDTGLWGNIGLYGLFPILDTQGVLRVAGEVDLPHGAPISTRPPSSVATTPRESLLMTTLEAIAIAVLAVSCIANAIASRALAKTLTLHKEWLESMEARKANRRDDDAWRGY